MFEFAEKLFLQVLFSPLFCETMFQKFIPKPPGEALTWLSFLRAGMEKHLRQNHWMKNGNFKHTLGKQENADGLNWQDVHGDKSGGKKQANKQTEEERNRNPVPNAHFFTCSWSSSWVSQVMSSETCILRGKRNSCPGEKGAEQIEGKTVKMRKG